jgi:hypothetical protein
VTSYLAKPLSEQVLLDTIREVLEDGQADGDACLPAPGTHAKDLI